jgi:hypothetical protein
MFLLTDKEKQYNDLSTLHTNISSSKNNVDLYEYTKEPQENETQKHYAYENRQDEPAENEPEEDELNDIEKDQPHVISVNESKQSQNLFSLFGSYST